MDEPKKPVAVRGETTRKLSKAERSSGPSRAYPSQRSPTYAKTPTEALQEDAGVSLATFSSSALQTDRGSDISQTIATSGALAAIGELLDKARRPYVVFRDNGVVLKVGPQFERLLRRLEAVRNQPLAGGGSRCAFNFEDFLNQLFATSKAGEDEVTLSISAGAGLVELDLSWATIQTNQVRLSICLLLGSRGITGANAFVLPEAFGLTAREAEIAAELLGGLSPAAVATSLKISVSTVRVHIKHIYNKLGVNSQLELMSYLHRLDP